MSDRGPPAMAQFAEPKEDAPMPDADAPAPEVTDPIVDAPPPESVTDEVIPAAVPADREPAPPVPIASHDDPPAMESVTLTPTAARMVDEAFAGVQNAERAFRAAQEQYRIVAAVAIAQAGADPGGGWRPVRDGDTLSFVRAVGPGGA